MEFTESLLRKYAKKVFGFAYSKTNDYHKAEDLSQDILITLCNKTLVGKGIDNMDAYIYRVCFYTWSKFLRKNKPHWDTLNDETIFEHLISDDNIEEVCVEKELYEMLRREVMYLSKTRREIFVMFYYDNKTGNEIANTLSISPSTVRWYLYQTKIDLKERIEMKESLNVYIPVRLNVGHCGWVKNYDMDGLCSDILMQNICYVCYGEAKTIEDIARILGVASIYLEDKIDKLLYMDYMKKVGINRYQTNFFIQDNKYILAKGKYSFENTMPLAEQFYNTVKSALPEIKKIGFIGCDRNDDEIMWNIMPLFIMMKTSEIDESVIAENHLEHVKPIRKDGTEHWVVAYMDDNKKECDSPELQDYLLHSGCCGIKTRGTETMCSLQFDLNLLGVWRDFDGEELDQLKRVETIIKNDETPNDYDKTIITNLIKKGYVSVECGKISILIPYFTAEQMEKLKRILINQSEKVFDDTKAKKLFWNFTEYINQYIPSFVDENERKHFLTSYDPQAASMYLLYKNGFLKEPDDAQKKRYCTLVWEK